MDEITQLASGAVVLSRYRLERELARGGMGSVWAGHDQKLRRPVAIKLMRPEAWVSSPDARARFEREAMAVAQLQCPHVVQIYDYGVERSTPLIVMELLEGEDLRQRLQRRRRLTLDATAAIMGQAAKALSEAHAAGIVHRDLKPGNLFLARGRHDEVVKVLDFGVAKADLAADHAKEDTKQGAILGTPQYMSPEQARGAANIDHRADLWSLGVIVYQCLTGRLPFLGESAADVIVKICTEPAPPPSSIVPDLPPDVDAFFHKALARAPHERFGSAREMAAAFARVSPLSFPSLNMPEPRPDIAAALEEAKSAVMRAPVREMPPVPAPQDSGIAMASPEELGLDLEPLGLFGLAPPPAGNAPEPDCASPSHPSGALGSGSLSASSLFDGMPPEPKPGSVRRRALIVLGAVGALGIGAAAALLGLGRPGSLKEPAVQTAAVAAPAGTAPAASAGRGAGGEEEEEPAEEEAPVAGAAEAGADAGPLARGTTGLAGGVSAARPLGGPWPPATLPPAGPPAPPASAGAKPPSQPTAAPAASGPRGSDPFSDRF
ncbi:MAG: protein kinase [Deltaproteobacteria bacterium]|nr:protein kinase [Deltaproteobacteria bacterium]